MVTALSMNPSIDLTLVIPRLTKGATHRVHTARRDIAGKAVNAVYALKNFGIPCRLVGFDFVENGTLLREKLQQANISHNLVATNGAIRTNIKIFEEETEVMTEVNQDGPQVTEKAINVLLETIAGTKTDILILNGSLPQGMNEDVYKRIIKRKPIPIILDAEGTALKSGLEAGPYIIKPNLSELEDLFSTPLPDQNARITACRVLLSRYSNLRIVCLSLGAEGAIMVSRDEAFFAPPLEVEIRSIHGAGDAMVAGIAAELFHSINSPISVLLKSAMAAAAATLMQEGSIMGTKENFEKLIKKVAITAI
ncbi:MAG: hexose kinase [Turicibacter sp.]|nr:hexose kinase [Turicibacter sp.]